MLSWLKVKVPHYREGERGLGAEAVDSYDSTTGRTIPSDAMTAARSSSVCRSVA